MAKQSTKQQKVEVTNPNTGRRKQIDAGTWNLFSAAIQETLKGKQPLTFTEMVEGVESYFKKKKIDFKQSVGWYAVTVKQDLEVRGVIKAYMEKGRKLHRLAKS